MRYIARHSPAMRTTACRLRSTSVSVVAHEDTLILIASLRARLFRRTSRFRPPGRAGSLLASLQAAKGY